METKGFDGKSRNYNAETYIEQRLWELCSENERKIKIYFDWQACKNDYMRRTSTIVYDFQHYSLHDHTHSTTILEGIEMFLGNERIAQLGIGDLWLLLQVAYGHDVGMAIRYEELKGLCEDKDFIEFLEQEIDNPDSNAQESILYYRQINNLIFGQEQMDGIDDKNRKKIQFENCWPLQLQRSMNVIIGEYLRANHGKRSERYIEKYTEGLCKDTEYRLFRLVGEVSYAHVTDFDYILNSLPYEVDGFGNEKMHPQFVAALLRIGDLLDMDNNRFDMYTLEHFGELPRISQAHLEKHLSISHLRITDTVIEAKGKTQSPEVAHVVQGWFNMLEREVKNITSRWNSIVPPGFGGCIFKTCDLQVFLNGNIYSSDNESNFKVDKHKLIQLLIGTQIYDSELEAFREYIQNAMDATKVKLWLDVLKGNYDYYLEEVQKEKSEIQPFDFSHDDLMRRAIEIEVEVLKKSAEVRFSIKDRGIGIDEECIDAISNIGKGWRGRKKYKKYISKMPKWLLPTGGFGIGMQSGFMLTDKVHILTKCEDQNACHIVLNSPNMGGEITRQSYSLNQEGTEIYFNIPVIRLFQVKRIQECLRKHSVNRIKDNEKEQLGGFFDYDRLPEVLIEVLSAYIKEIVPNSLIPIRMKCKSARINTVITGNFYNYLDGDKVYDEKNRIMSMQTNSGMAFWDEKKCVYMEFDVSGKEEGRFCFRNVLVRHTSKEDKLLDKTGGYLIDFMGFRTEECLQIDRNSFLDTFNPRTYKLQCIHLIVSEMAKREEWIPFDMFAKGTDVVRVLVLIDGVYYGYNENVEKMLRDDLTIEARYVKSDEQGNCKIREGEYPLSELYDVLAHKKYPVFYVSDKLWNEDRYATYYKFDYSAEDKTDKSLLASYYKPDIFKAFEDDTPILWTGKEKNRRRDRHSYVKEMIPLILEDFWSDGPVFQFRIGDNSENISMIQETTREILTERDLFVSAVTNRKFYLEMPKYDSEYDYLYVDKLPFETENEIVSEEGRNLILIPFSLSIYGMLEQKNKAISLNEFLDMVKNGDNFRSYVDWAMKYSRYKKNPERKKVEDAYISLCKKIYKYTHENSGEKGF